MKENQEESVLDLWIARDKDYEYLNLFYGKPSQLWVHFCGDILKRLDYETFPEITWDNSPVKLKVTIESFTI